MAMPRPPAEMRKLTSIIQPGTYTCEGRTSLMGREHPVQGTAKVESDLNGFWQRVVYEEKKTGENASPLVAEEHFSFDPSMGKFVRIAVDNMGGHTTMTAPVTEANRLSFSGEGTMGGRATPQQFTIVQVSPKEVTVTLTTGGEAADHEGAPRQGAADREGAAGGGRLQLTCRR
jgi:hypothetical protein